MPRRSAASPTRSSSRTGNSALVATST
jgi:hypothetical protein